MKETFIIFKKELFRFFNDKRMVFSIMLLPGLLIFMIYSIMGIALADKYTVSEDYVYRVYGVNVPKDFKQIMESSSITVIDVEELTKEEIRKCLSEKEVDAVVSFPKAFEASPGLTQDVRVFYASTENTSQAAYSELIALLRVYEDSIVDVFTVNKVTNDSKERYDVSTEEETVAMTLSMVLPVIVLSLVVSACASVAPESIAGEKERGTLATILITPINRSSLALGKIFALSIIAALSGFSTMLGIVLSLPRLMATDNPGIDISIYSGQDAFKLLVVILSTVLVIVGLMSVISGYAKGVREASSLAAPLMLVTMVVGVSSIFDSTAKTNAVYYLIPLYNSVQCMNGILATGFNVGYIILTVVINMVYLGGLAFWLSKIFNDERFI